jgi:hypothetical protein
MALGTKQHCPHFETGKVFGEVVRAGDSTEGSERCSDSRSSSAESSVCPKIQTVT